MASTDPPSISNPEVKDQWVVEISKILHHQLQIDVETETPSVSLFQLPKTITTKPEAYEPQQIGLGPMHHFRPQPYKKMEQKKLAVMRGILQVHSESKDLKLNHVVEKVKKLVPVVRSCYDMFLEGDDEQLAWIFAIDGLFLLQVFHGYNSPIERAMEEHKLGLVNKLKDQIESGDDFPSLAGTNARIAMNHEDIDEETTQIEVVVTADDHEILWERTVSFPRFHPELPKISPKKRSVARDVTMVENQIPFMVLQEIHEALISCEGCSSHSTYHLSPSLFRVFCMVHSPLKLCSQSQAPSTADHLLHYMYHSIIKNAPVPKPPVRPAKHDFHGLKRQTRILEEVCTLVKNIPQDEIVQAYEQTISVLETFCETRAIIPSASDLHDKGGFRFHRLEDDHGLQNIRIKGKDVYLPVITLNKDSDVILRNLIAYETLITNSDRDRDSLVLTEYMVLMCALVINADDVKRLENVIKFGDLDENEVAELFIGINKCLPAMKMKEGSKIQELIDEINKGYYSMLRMKPYLILKKLAYWLLVALRGIGGFVGSSWKIVAYVVGLVSVFLLTKQAYCDAYGCK